MHPDGRVQRLRRAIGRQGDARPGWQVLADLAARLGLDPGVLTSPMATAQVVEAVPFYAGLTLDEIGGKGVRWQEREAASAYPEAGFGPFDVEAPPAAPDANGRLRLGTFCSIWVAPEVQVSPALKFLDTGRVVELSPADAQRLNVFEGETVVGQRRRARGAREGRRARRGARGHRLPRGQRARRRARGGAQAMSTILATVDYYEPWYVQIIKAVIIFAVGLQIVPLVLHRRAQAARALPGPLRPQPRRPVRPRPAAGRHHQARDEGAVPPAHLDRLAVRPRADHLDPHRGRGVRDHPVRRDAGHLRHARRPLRGRRSASARCTCSPSARSPSTGSCSAAGRRARSTRSSARCAPPRSSSPTRSPRAWRSSAS